MWSIRFEHNLSAIVMKFNFTSSPPNLNTKRVNFLIKKKLGKKKIEGSKLIHESQISGLISYYLCHNYIR